MRKQVQKGLLFGLDAADAIQDRQAGSDISIDAQRALTALRTLPETYAETLIMRLVEGLTGPEIAERTGLTAASVRVKLHRGMALLRDALAMVPTAASASTTTAATQEAV